MHDLVELWEKPHAKEIYMVAGWRQWADAGSISSELPEFLIAATEARQIGKIKNTGLYLFQIPGTHHLLRPEIKLEEGFRQELRVQRNEIYYTGDENKGLVIFLGDEPHMNIEGYAAAFFDVVEALGVKRVVCVGGVYAPMPYDRAREVSCIYSQKPMKAEMGRYAVKFSDYEGGVTIGTYLASAAEERGIELVVFYAFVPSYDFSSSPVMTEGIRIESDYKAWYELMRRINFMFGLYIDLADLERESEELVESMRAQVVEFKQANPELPTDEYLAKINREFQEDIFMPMDETLENQLNDLLDDLGE